MDKVQNEAIASFSLGDDLERDYLFYLFQNINYDDYLDTYLKGKTLNKGKLQIFPIPLPPPPEQRAIAHVLRIVQQAREATEHVIEAAHELKRSLMRHLLTYGPVPVAQADQVELQETEIGPIPAHWGMIPFADVVEIAKGQVDPKEEPYNKMFHVGPADIESETGKLLPLQTAEESGLISGKYLFHPGDVLYSKIRPYLKKAALPTFTGICSADMYPLKPDKELLSEFLFQFLLSESFTSQAVSFQSRTGIPKINRLQLGLIPLPIPPFSEQQEIARIFAAIDTKITVEEARRDALDDLFYTLLHHLMTAKVRVPLQ